jgi:hypothetical protein
VKDIENELVESIILKRELDRIFLKEIDWSIPSNKSFLKQFAGAIMLLVPEAAAFLIENGLKDDDETIYGVMMAIGTTMKEVGEKGLRR